ncbi:MAG TPA: hypothetical protein VGM84_08925 [Steroidobacteraceae bacterium]|jgi:hypothetical protein
MAGSNARESGFATPDQTIDLAFGFQPVIDLAAGRKPSRLGAEIGRLLNEVVA